jgi:hypothetical protein
MMFGAKAINLSPLLPAKAGTQGHTIGFDICLLDSRLRGNERVGEGAE